MLLSARQAAEQLGIDLRALYRVVEAQRIRSVTVGRKLRFEQEAVDDYLALLRYEAKTPKEKRAHFVWALLGPNEEMEKLLEPENVLANKGPLPANQAGIYFLYQDDELVYIGQSVNVFGRIAQHIGKKQFNQFSWLSCERADLNELEHRAITKFQPKLNKLC